MDSEQWRHFLAEYNRELLGTPEIIRELPVDVLDSGWLGYSPADEASIANKEREMGVTFPPSLRAFYQVTNGWRTVSSFIWEILPIHQIGFLRDLEPHLYQLASETEAESGPFKHDPEGRRLKEYRYDEGTRVKRSVLLNRQGDASYWLLDPEVPTGKEWPAGRWASWNPGMEWQAASFAELMRKEFKGFLSLRDRR